MFKAYLCAHLLLFLHKNTP